MATFPPRKVLLSRWVKMLVAQGVPLMNSPMNSPLSLTLTPASFSWQSSHSSVSMLMDLTRTLPGLDLQTPLRH